MIALYFQVLWASKLPLATPLPHSLEVFMTRPTVDLSLLHMSLSLEVLLKQQSSKVALSQGSKL